MSLALNSINLVGEARPPLLQLESDLKQLLEYGYNKPEHTEIKMRIDNAVESLEPWLRHNIPPTEEQIAEHSPPPEAVLEYKRLLNIKSKAREERKGSYEEEKLPQFRGHKTFLPPEDLKKRFEVTDTRASQPVDDKETSIGEPTGILHKEKARGEVQQYEKSSSPGRKSKI